MNTLHIVPLEFSQLRYEKKGKAWRETRHEKLNQKLFGVGNTGQMCTK